ncbi:hypothetical protein HK096_010308, partial [Nowakowskiella sp. JEL0078]
KETGIRTSAVITIASVMDNMSSADLVEDTEYEGEPPGFRWIDKGGKVSSKVMNPTYDLGDYGLTQNSVKGTIDIVVMVPLLGI